SAGGGRDWRAAAASAFLAAGGRGAKAVAPYFGGAERRAKAGQRGAAARCLCSLIEENPGSAEVARQVGYQLVAIGHAAIAARILDQVVRRTPADGEAHRARAMALEDSGRPARAALHYEVAMAQLGEHAGYAALREELVQVLRRALGDMDLSRKLHSHFSIRLAELGKESGEREPAELRVTVTWDAPGAEVQLV